MGRKERYRQAVMRFRDVFVTCLEHSSTLTRSTPLYKHALESPESAIMSLTRQFFRELGPLFRMLEQPFGRTPAFYGPRHWNRFDPFQEIEVRPSIDVTEQGNKYVLDAELPGVNKGNIEIRVGDGGRSITIEGKVVEKNRNNQVSHDSVATVGKW